MPRLVWLARKPARNSSSSGARGPARHGGQRLVVGILGSGRLVRVVVQQAEVVEGPGQRALARGFGAVLSTNASRSTSETDGSGASRLVPCDRCLTGAQDAMARPAPQSLPSPGWSSAKSLLKDRHQPACQSSLAWTFNDLGLLYYNTDQPTRSKDAHDKALALRAELVRAHPEDGRISRRACGPATPTWA